MTRWQDDVERYGLRQVLCGRLFSYLERLGVHVWVVQTRPLHSHFDMPSAHAARFRFALLTLESAGNAATRDSRLKLPETFLHAALARGDVGCGAFEGDRLVAYTWRTMTRAPVAGPLWIHLLDATSRYGYKSLVLPEYRGSRLNVSVARFHDRWFVERGIHRDVGYVALANLASLRSTYRDPERVRVGYAGYLRLGSRYATFRSRDVRRYFELVTADPRGAATDDSA